MTAALVDPNAVMAAAAAQQQATRRSVLGYLLALFGALRSWRNDDAARFAAAAAGAVTGGQQRTGALTAAALTQLVTAGGGVPPQRVALDGLDDTALRGVPAVEVYQRPFRQLWWDLSRDVPLEQAVKSAEQRVQSLAATDLQLAKTATSQRVLADSGKVTGYRRVLTGAASCALCVLASSRTYHKAELLPIHPGCDCATAPLFDHAQAPDVAADLHEAIRDTLGPRYVSVSGRTAAQDYRDLVIVHEHGELGPVVAVRAQQWTGPDDVLGGR